MPRPQPPASAASPPAPMIAATGFPSGESDSSSSSSWHLMPDFAVAYPGFFSRGGLLRRPAPGSQETAAEHFERLSVGGGYHEAFAAAPVASQESAVASQESAGGTSASEASQ